MSNWNVHLKVCQREMNTLSNAEAIHISTVLEDCIDQLIILGRLMPVPYQKKEDAEQVPFTCFVFIAHHCSLSTSTCLSTRHGSDKLQDSRTRLAC